MKKTNDSYGYHSKITLRKIKKKNSLQPHKIIFAHTGKKNLQEGVVWLD